MKALTHAEVQERLPWYQNATLPAGEREQVAAHLASCAECAGEQARWRALAAAAQGGAPAPPLPPAAGLARVRERITQPERLSLLARVREGWSRFWGPLPLAARLAFTLPYVVVLALAVLLLARPDGGARFQTASGGGEGTTRVLLAVGFADGVTEAELRRTLREIRGTIVSGPSALGLYVVEVPLSTERPEEIEALLGALRSRQGVVAVAERKR